VAGTPFEPAGPSTEESPAIVWTNGANGEMVVCEQETVTDRPQEPPRAGAWWDDLAITHAVVPLIKHAAAVTGWQGATDRMYAHSALAMDDVTAELVPSWALPLGVSASEAIVDAHRAQSPLYDKQRGMSL
jgi:hypothetical protein